MNTSYLNLQLSVTKALIKFIRDHEGQPDNNLVKCLSELENGNIEDAVQRARMVKPHGVGGITDWFPRPLGANESFEYNEVVLRALVNEWCRAISLSIEERDSVSLGAQEGALDARLRQTGYVLCPFCGKTFSSKNPVSWDGAKHTTCGVRLNLIPGVDPNAACWRRHESEPFPSSAPTLW